MACIYYDLCNVLRNPHFYVSYIYIYISYIYFSEQVNRLRHVGGPDGNHRVLVFIIWLLSVGNRVLSRLCFFIGAAVACSEVYIGINQTNLEHFFISFELIF